MTERRLANISMLMPTLWTGGDLDPRERVAEKQMTEIVNLGITHVVDLRQEWTDATFVESFGIRCTHIAMDDHGGRQQKKLWEAVYNTLDDAWFDNDVVLVHCHMGVNRGPSAAGLALMSEEFNMDPIEAWDLIRERRPMAWAIYMPQAAKFLGLDHKSLQRHIDKHDDGSIVDTIGRIRQLQSAGVIINHNTVMEDK